MPRWEHVTWAGALRGHRLHPSQARAVRVPKGLPPLGHERIFVAGPGGCLPVHLGSTCWLISASRARPPPPHRNSKVAVGSADPGCGESRPGRGEQVAVTGCAALREAGLGRRWVWARGRCAQQPSCATSLGGECWPRSPRCWPLLRAVGRRVRSARHVASAGTLPCTCLPAGLRAAVTADTTAFTGPPGDTPGTPGMPRVSQQLWAGLSHAVLTDT